MSANQTELNLIAGNVKKAVGGASSGDLWMVERSRLRFHPKLQPRDRTTQPYKERVRHLANLMKANGYDRAFPVKVFAAKEDGEDVLYVVQGHRRVEAVDLAIAEGKEIEFVPCVTTDRGTNMEDLIFATINGNEGDPLAPIEKAKQIKELLGCNLQLDYIAQRLGYGVGYVKSLLAILETPREVCNMVQEGQVAANVAVQTVREHGKDAAAVLKAGREVAQAQAIAKAKGKGKAVDLEKVKVTPKHLKKVMPQPPKRVSGTPTPAPATESSSAILRAAQWIAKEVKVEDEYPYLALVATTLSLNGTTELQGEVAKLRA
jgi:5-formyltetrahydrofolate cyclo-ligase